MKSRYQVTTQPESIIKAQAIREGWEEGESFWDYMDPSDWQQVEYFKSSQLAFLAARKAAPLDVWGSVQIREEQTDKENPRESDWTHVATWEVTKGQRVLGRPTFEGEGV